MIPTPLRQFLDSQRVPYHVRQHAPRWTAQETAQMMHVSGKRFAKAVLVRTQDEAQPEYLLAVLPANEQVDLALLGAVFGRPVQLAVEEDFARLFPGYEAGAPPPFGELARIPVIVDRCLENATSIFFHGGTHVDVIEMRWDDFARLARPQLVDYGRLPNAPMPESRAPY
jgi:Ala-tRNA(Pro) deacylase